MHPLRKASASRAQGLRQGYSGHVGCLIRIPVPAVVLARIHLSLRNLCIAVKAPGRRLRCLHAPFGDRKDRVVCFGQVSGWLQGADAKFFRFSETQVTRTPSQVMQEIPLQRSFLPCLGTRMIELRRCQGPEDFLQGSRTQPSCRHLGSNVPLLHPTSPHQTPRGN